MDDTNKLPLKRVELSLTKFNDVAIPHLLDLLRQHKANIIKYEECGNWARVRTEQTHARRVAAQLRALLAEMEALRRQVMPQDHARFDALTQRSRDLTLKSIVDYLETSPLSANRPRARPGDSGDEEGAAGVEGVAGSVTSADSVGLVLEPELLQLQVDEHERALQARSEVLAGWCELQGEVRALHEAWHGLHAAARAQREPLATAASSVQVAADNVQAARQSLWSIERMRAGAYGAGGAALGALLGGPVGLLVGAKAGAVALLAGSACGYWGARVLGARRQQQLGEGEAATDERKTQ